MIFTTIEPSPGLSPAERRQVARSGPSAVLTRTTYRSLLKTAGFGDVEHTDITADYRTRQQAWISATRRRAVTIGAAIGEQALARRLDDRGAALAVIDEGLLRRSLYTATRR